MKLLLVVMTLDRARLYHNRVKRARGIASEWRPSLILPRFCCNVSITQRNPGHDQRSGVIALTAFFVLVASVLMTLASCTCEVNTLSDNGMCIGPRRTVQHVFFIEVHSQCLATVKSPLISAQEVATAIKIQIWMQRGPAALRLTLLCIDAKGKCSQYDRQLQFLACSCRNSHCSCPMRVPCVTAISQNMEKCSPNGRVHHWFVEGHCIPFFQLMQVMSCCGWPLRRNAHRKTNAAHCLRCHMFLLHQFKIHQPIHSTRTYGWIATVGTPAKVLPVRLMHLLVSLRCKCLPAAIILILPSNTQTVHNTGDILLNLQLLSQHCNFIRHNFHLILQGCTLFLCRCKLLLLVSQHFPQLSGSIVQHLCCDVLGLCMGTACGICPSDIVWRCCAQCSREVQRGYRTNGASTTILFRLSLLLSLLFPFLLFLLCTVDPRFLRYFCQSAVVAVQERLPTKMHPSEKSLQHLQESGH